MVHLPPLRSNGPEVIGIADWIRALRPTARTGAEHLPHLIGYWVSARRAGGGAGPPVIPPPESTWVTEAHQTLTRIKMDPMWVRHSERTWHFAAGLAAADRVEVDHEMLYVAALLHDSGLCDPDRAVSFATAGGRLAMDAAEAASVHKERACMVARAIDSHISADPGNVLGRYLQWGSLLDLIGFRIWRLDRRIVDQACEEWTRAGFRNAVHEEWPKECDLFPHGRAAYARCPGMMLRLTRFAPLPDRL